MVVKNDVNALNTARMLQTNTRAQNQSMQKLASGYKINKAADDAADLAISEKMMKQIEGINKAIDNASDGMAMADVADGAMDEVGGMLQRLNELAIQGSNGTLSDSDRSAINDEANQLLQEIDRVGGGTEFNETKVLEDNDSNIQAGADGSGSNKIAISMQSINSDTLGVSGINLSTANGSRAALTNISDAIKNYTGQRAETGATYNRMASTSRNLANVSENTTAAYSKIRDTDMASEMIKKRNKDTLAQSNLAMMRKQQEERQARASQLNNFNL